MLDTVLNPGDYQAVTELDLQGTRKQREMNMLLKANWPSTWSRRCPLPGRASCGWHRGARLHLMPQTM
jgi:hypothetical protein